MKPGGYRRTLLSMIVLEIVAAWFGLSALGLMGAVGACRAGHAEDVARGYTD